MTVVNHYIPLSKHWENIGEKQSVGQEDGLEGTVNLDVLLARSVDFYLAPLLKHKPFAY